MELFCKVLNKYGLLEAPDVLSILMLRQTYYKHSTLIKLLISTTVMKIHLYNYMSLAMEQICNILTALAIEDLVLL